MLQPTLTNRTMMIFSCLQLGSSPQDYFLRENLALRCWSEQHLILVFLFGLPMLILYVLGIPLGILVLLKKNSAFVIAHISSTLPRQMLVPELRSTDAGSMAHQEFRQKYAFLYEGYCANYFWWEVICMLRKALLQFIAVFFASSYYAQSLFGFTLIMASLSAHLRAFAYIDANLNYLEGLSLVVTSVTFLCGQFTFVDLGYGFGVTTTASIIALVVNGSYFFCLIYFLVVILRQYRQQRHPKKEKGGSIRSCAVEMVEMVPEEAQNLQLINSPTLEPAVIGAVLLPSQPTSYENEPNKVATQSAPHRDPTTCWESDAIVLGGEI